MTTTILHLDMDAFFASIEQQKHPELRGKPIAVAGGIEKRSVVATCSYEARARGVKTAMSTWEAKKLCPELEIVIGHMSLYSEISKQIFAIFPKYSDLVENFSIDEAFMDLTHSAHLFGGPMEVARKIKREIRERFGLTCSIGIAPSKTIAKVASTIRKPNGLLMISPDEVPKFLENLPVEELCGIGPRFKSHLHRMGVRTVGEMGRISKERFTKRFGPATGEWFWRLGHGRDASPIRPYVVHDPAKSMGHSYTLPKNMMDREEVKTYLLQLSEQVGIRLRKGGYSGRVVSFGLRYGDFAGTGRSRDIHYYTNDGHTIYEHAVDLMKEVDDTSQPIRWVGVTLSSLMAGDRQLSFLRDDLREESLLRAVDAIRQKWGKKSIVRARLIKNELAEKVGMVAREEYRS